MLMVCRRRDCDITATTKPVNNNIPPTYNELILLPVDGNVPEAVFDVIVVVVLGTVVVVAVSATVIVLVTVTVPPLPSETSTERT